MAFIKRKSKSSEGPAAVVRKKLSTTDFSVFL